MKFCSMFPYPNENFGAIFVYLISIHISTVICTLSQKNKTLSLFQNLRKITGVHVVYIRIEVSAISPIPLCKQELVIAQLDADGVVTHEFTLDTAPYSLLLSALQLHWDRVSGSGTLFAFASSPRHYKSLVAFPLALDGQALKISVGVTCISCIFGIMYWFVRRGNVCFVFNVDQSPPKCIRTAKRSRRSTWVNRRRWSFLWVLQSVPLTSNPLTPLAIIIRLK